MRKSTLIDTADTGSFEQRRLPRKNVLLSGMLVSATGETAWECVIRDMHASGAAISVLRPLQVGSRVFLLDTANAAAHDARVAWSRADRSGLCFTRSYAMGLGLPPAFKFLWRLLFEAKLQQAERAVAAGASAEVALSAVGLSRERIHQIVRQAMPDKKIPQLLARVRRLNANQGQRP